MIRDPPSHIASHIHLLWDSMDLFVAALLIFFFFFFVDRIGANTCRQCFHPKRLDFLSKDARGGADANVNWNENEDQSFRKCRSGAADSLRLTKADSQFRAGQKALPSPPSLPRPPPRPSPFSKPLSVISQTRCPDVSKKGK